MNGLNPAYVESVIRKAKEGKLTTGQAESPNHPWRRYVLKAKKG